MSKTDEALRGAEFWCGYYSGQAAAIRVMLQWVEAWPSEKHVPPEFVLEKVTDWAKVAVEEADKREADARKQVARLET